MYNKYQEALQQLDTEVYRNMPEQCTIDTVQDVVQELITDCGVDGPLPEEVRAWHYKADTLLEVYNPELKKDYEFISRLETILKEWSNALS